MLKQPESMQDKQHFVELQADATGVHRDGPSAIPSMFYYNIGEVQLAEHCTPLLSRADGIMLSASC